MVSASNIELIYTQFSLQHCELPDNFWFLLCREDVDRLIDDLFERYYGQAGDAFRMVIADEPGAIRIIAMRKSKMSIDQLSESFCDAFRDLGMELGAARVDENTFYLTTLERVMNNAPRSPANKSEWN